MTKSQHTPTPWKAEKDANTSGSFNVFDDTGIRLAIVTSGPAEFTKTYKGYGCPEYIGCQGEANAALIVKAVNEREEILQTVRSAMTILERDRDAMQGWHILAGLLAKAEAE